MSNRLLAMFAAGALLTGCASTSTFGLARTMNKGGVQGWVAPSVGALVANSRTAGVSAYPMVEGGVRFGLSDNVELGARLGFSGLAAEGKFALIRSPTMESGFNLSLNPQVQLAGFGVGATGSTAGAVVGALSFHLPVLLGFDFFGHELVVGPRVIDQVVFGSVTGTSGGSAAGNLIYFGGSVGFAIRVAPGFRILPEVSLAAPLIATGSTTTVGYNGLIVQGGVGFLFGNATQYEPKVERARERERERERDREEEAPAPPPAQAQPLAPTDLTPPPMPPPAELPPPPPPAP